MFERLVDLFSGTSIGILITMLFVLIWFENTNLTALSVVRLLCFLWYCSIGFLVIFSILAVRRR